MRRFYLQRDQDKSGVSGTGRVAEGVLLPSGRVMIEWNGTVPSIGLFGSLTELKKIHGHKGMTKVVWLDEEEGTVVPPDPREGPAVFTSYSCHGCKWLEKQLNHRYWCMHPKAPGVQKQNAEPIDSMGHTPQWCVLRGKE